MRDWREALVILDIPPGLRKGCQELIKTPAEDPQAASSQENKK